MPKAGDVIRNPVTGDQIVFLLTAHETNGALLRFETVSAVGRRGPPLHLHEVTEERFEVLSGKLGVIVGAQRDHHILEPGQSLVVPPGMPHTFYNAGDEPVRSITEMRPAGGFATALETLYGLASDGKVSKRGAPRNIWQLAIITQQTESWFVGAPIGVQKAIFGVLATLARWLGYSESYPDYRAQPDADLKVQG